MSDQTVSLDKLIVCSQPLYDFRLSRLRNEIEELKLKLFWAKNNRLRLKSLISYHGHSINCPCLNCHDSDRTHNEIYADEDCIWQPIFEKAIVDCGLTFDPSNQHDDSKVSHLGSGLGGTWAFPGFTGLLDIKDFSILSRYEEFVKNVYADATKRFNIIYRDDNPDSEDMDPTIDIDEIYANLDQDCVVKTFFSFNQKVTFLCFKSYIFFKNIINKI
jgi:hypothetical protein